VPRTDELLLLLLLLLLLCLQDDQLGPAGHIPELQFLDKNSKFKVGSLHANIE
jgi:hypothetical protein